MDVGFDNRTKAATRTGGRSLLPELPLSSHADCQAIIEIGTNSVKVLVARVAGGQVIKLFGASQVTRLGQGLATSRSLTKEAIHRTVSVVADFAHEARKFQPKRLRVIATCASREAANPLELFQAVTQQEQLPVEVISGEQEAEWAFRGVRSDPNLSRCPLMVVDLGGGSTQVVVGEESCVHLRSSFPIGCLRLLETINPADPPIVEDLRRCEAWLANYLEREVAPKLEPVLQNLRAGSLEMVAIGGTASVVAALCAPAPAPKPEGQVVDLAGLERHIRRWWSLSQGRRHKLRGLPVERADTILTGSVVLQQIMRYFGFQRFRFSECGVRYGALLEPSNFCGIAAVSDQPPTHH